MVKLYSKRIGRGRSRGSPSRNITKKVDVMRLCYTLTPIQKYGNNYVKRDDLFEYAERRGGKVRAALYGINKSKANCLITVGNKNSPQINVVSSIGRNLGKPVVAFTYTGVLGNEVKLAKEKGATIMQVSPAYKTSAVIIKKAKAYAKKNNCHYIPYGMNTSYAHKLTAEQVKNIPSNIKRIVISVGGASSIIGVIKGIIKFKKNVKVVGVVVGANTNITKTLDKYIPNWRSVASLVFSNLKYSEPAPITNFNGIELDPYFDAKILPYIKRGDLLWIIGIREGLESRAQKHTRKK